MASKSLTFKSPDKMKVLGLIFLALFILSPNVRYTTGSVLHTVANVIQGEQ